MRLIIAFAVVVALSACSDDQPQADALQAQFSARFDQPATGPTSCPVVAVHFTDESIGDPTAWEWTFGDGTKSTEQNPTWEPGAAPAEVTLKISRGDAEDSITELVDTHDC